MCYYLGVHYEELLIPLIPWEETDETREAFERQGEAGWRGEVSSLFRTVLAYQRDG